MWILCLGSLDFLSRCLYLLLSHGSTNFELVFVLFISTTMVFLCTPYWYMAVGHTIKGKETMTMRCVSLFASNGCGAYSVETFFFTLPTSFNSECLSLRFYYALCLLRAHFFHSTNNFARRIFSCLVFTEREQKKMCIKTQLQCSCCLIHISTVFNFSLNCLCFSVLIMSIFAGLSIWWICL